LSGFIASSDPNDWQATGMHPFTPARISDEVQSALLAL
jgi:hypothetical protein